MKIPVISELNSKVSVRVKFITLGLFFLLMLVGSLATLWHTHNKHRKILNEVVFQHAKPFEKASNYSYAFAVYRGDLYKGFSLLSTGDTETGMSVIQNALKELKNWRTLSKKRRQRNIPR